MSSGSGAGNRLCRFHLDEANGRVFRADGKGFAPATGPDPGFADNQRGGLRGHLAPHSRKFKEASLFVLNANSTKALAQLGLPPTPGFDPKTSLIAAVESAHRQRLVYEAMLAGLPQESFALLGTPPIPGLPATAQGARAEIIQKFLFEATKNAARVSKLAIDAGIEERLVRLAEEQSALIADTVRSAVVASIKALATLLRLNPADEAAATDRALTAAASHLRQLAAGGQEVVEGVARVVQPGPTPTIRHYPKKEKEVPSNDQA